jgi:hypothetical protein
MTTSPGDPSGTEGGPGGPSDGIVPDTKDWTWTLERACPECGVAAGTVPAAALAERLRAVTRPWPVVLARPDVRERPDPGTWSPLEYACHVRDVCRLFERRLRLILEQDEPTFENWDQDRTAVEERYAEQDPSRVAPELAVAAEMFAAAVEDVTDSDWERTGIRSDGSRFTVLTLGQYGFHDVAHHLHDVGVAIP